MRISDWRSDVCSSDLRCQGVVGQISERSALSIAEPRQRHLVRQGDVRRRQAGEDAGWRSWGKRGVAGGADGGAGPVAVAGAGAARRRPAAVRPGDRKRVVLGKSVSVRGESGGSRIIKKKTT